MAPAPVINNKRVAFLLHPSVGIIELLEMEDERIGISV